MITEPLGSVLITGASSGFGEAIALAFAKLSKPLVLGARRMEKLEAVAEACRRAGSPNVSALQLDVTDQGSIERFCDRAQRGGSTKAFIEVLVNNAGMARGRDPVAQIADDDLVEMIETNVVGFLRVARGILPGMIERKRGHVVNLGSLAAHGVYEGGGVYAATKHAMRAISETLRLELSGTNIRVTEIAPGMAETGFSIVRMGGEEKAKKVYAGMRPLLAQDIADCVVWAVTRPEHVMIREIVLTSVDQASLTKVHRS